MSLQRWLSNPLTAFRDRHQSVLEQLEEEANGGALSLPQPAVWVTRLTQVMLVGLTAAGVWSVVARVDVVVNARGKLEPVSQTQAVQSRVGGVVTDVMVREGETVKKGQLLVQLDKAPLYNQLQSLSTQRQRFLQEVALLRMARQGAPVVAIQQMEGDISPELMNRIQSRSLLIAQLSGDPRGLSPEQQQRFELFQRQMTDQLAVNRLQVSSLQEQIRSAESQMSETRYQLEVEQGLLNDLQPLAQAGGISRVDVRQREVGVSELRSQIEQTNRQRRQLQLDQMQTQVESTRLQTEAYQGVQQQLTAIDAQFDTTIDNNQRELIQLAAQIKQVQFDLKSQDLRAPADGVVFNLVPKLPGVVAQPGQVLLQVVPSESLVARVQVANADIANIREGMPVDVRIDAYPFTEFGSASGVVTRVSREALPSNPQAPGQTVFPVEIKLDGQFLDRQGKPMAMTPGMTLGASIKVRSRAPISYVADELTRVFDGMRSVR